MIKMVPATRTVGATTSMPGILRVVGPGLTVAGEVDPSLGPVSVIEGFTAGGTMSESFTCGAAADAAGVSLPRSPYVEKWDICVLTLPLTLSIDDGSAVHFPGCSN
jgi:hypothetical protein